MDLSPITEDGTFTIDETGTIRNAVEGIASGFVVALGKLADAATLNVGEMFGRWTDEDGTVYWDRVTILSDVREAVTMAKTLGELAIWDLSTNSEIRTN